MTLYRITDWQKHYESHDSQRTKAALNWVRIRTKQDGSGYRRMASERDRSDLFAAWILIIEVAAKLPIEFRGKLVTSDGRPLDSEDLSLMTGWPTKVFERALKFFSSNKMGWLSSSEIGEPETDISAPIRMAPDESGQTRYREEERREDKTLGKAAETASASDADWLAQLAADSAYAGINVSEQHGKMLNWCAVNRKQPTRRRFVNWLNRCDKPMGMGAAQPRKPQPKIPEPDNWRELLRIHQGDHAWTPDLTAKDWGQLTQSEKQWVADAVRRIPMEERREG